MYIFLFPAFQNLVCILEAGLTCLKDSTVAGFLDDLHGKAIGSKPGVHQCDLCLYGIAVGDSESLENRKIVFIISGAGLLGFFHRGNPLLSPGKSHLLDVADALVIVAHAIFNQIFDQVSRHAKAIIEEKHLLNFCRWKCFAKILFGYIKKLDDIFVLFQFIYTVRSKCFCTDNRLVLRLFGSNGNLILHGIRRTGRSYRSEKRNSAKLIIVCEIKSKKLLFGPVFQCTENISLGAEKTVCHLLQTERNRSTGKCT